MADERLISLVHRACDVMHLAAAILKDRAMPEAAEALNEQAILLTDFVSDIETIQKGKAK